MKNEGRFIVLLVVLVVASALSVSLFLRDRGARDVTDVRKLPMKMGEWTGRDLEITKREYDILETKNIVFRDYVNKAGNSVNLFIVYSETNRSVFHPPEVCLMGDGSEVVDKKQEKIEFDKRSFFVNKLYLEKGRVKTLVLYCFKAAGLYTDNYPRQQAYFALCQLLGRRVPGATIRVSMPIRGDETATLLTLRAFFKEAVKAIEDIV